MGHQLTDPDLARAFLRRLFRAGSDDWRVRIMSAGEGLHAENLWTRPHQFGSIARVLEYSEGTTNIEGNGPGDKIARSIFVAVNPCRTTLNGVRENVLCRNAFVLDVDEDKNKVSAAVVFEELNRVKLEPTLIVSSGHGTHVYFILDEPLADLDLGDHINKWLVGLAAVSDNVWDTSRIMRLPGSVNFKVEDDANPPLVTVDYWSGPYYKAETIVQRLCNARIPPPIQRRAAVPDLRPGDTSRIERILYHFATEFPALYTMISTGEIMPDLCRRPDGSVDRSEVDFFVVTCLMREGASDADVRSVYASQPVSRIKVDRSGGAYLEKTIENARKRIGSTLAPQFDAVPPDDSESLFKWENGRWRIRPWRHVKNQWKHYPEWAKESNLSKEIIIPWQQKKLLS